MKTFFILFTAICLSEGFLLKRQSGYYSNQGYPSQSQNSYYQNQRYPTGNGNQGYNNQGYANQRYSNQGYNNQGYANQGYSNQGYSQQSTTTMSPEDADAQAAEYMDPFILLAHASELTNIYPNGSHIIQDILTNSSLSEAERVEKIATWYNELSQNDIVSSNQKKLNIVNCFRIKNS